MSTYNEAAARKRITTARLAQMKQQGEKIACLTSYDFTMSRLADAAGIDLILVGDSAANVMMGYETTLPITLDEMITYAKGAVRGAATAMVIVDLPFGYYQADATTALHSAVRIMKETGAAGVKMEGGAEIADSVRAILAAGIPVCAHLGLTPQSVNKFGGYGIRAKAEAEAQKLIDDALLMQNLGCFAVVLEKIPAPLAAKVTETLDIPTIGIGAGNATSGQILVAQDMLGMNDGFRPKFLRVFGQVGTAVTEAIGSYVQAVKEIDFPNATEQY